MIINKTENKLKMIIDEDDLLNNNINKKEFISNPLKIPFFLEKLCKNYSNLNLKKFDIYTYNFKIFQIEIHFFQDTKFSYTQN